MGLRLILGAVALTGLAACGDDTRDYPALLPTADVLAEPAIPGHAADAAADDSLGAALDARGKALAGRAGGPPMTDSADLQARADALKKMLIAQGVKATQIARSIGGGALGIADADNQLTVEVLKHCPE